MKMTMVNSGVKGLTPIALNYSHSVLFLTHMDKRLPKHFSVVSHSIFSRKSGINRVLCWSLLQNRSPFTQTMYNSCRYTLIHACVSATATPVNSVVIVNLINHNHFKMLLKGIRVHWKIPDTPKTNWCTSFSNVFARAWWWDGYCPHLPHTRYKVLTLHATLTPKTDPIIFFFLNSY